MLNKLFVGLGIISASLLCPMLDAVEYVPGVGSNLPLKTENLIGDENPAIIRMMSYNIRVDHEQDANCENKWSVRRPILENVIARYDGDVIALQEPNEQQVSDLKETFGAQYDFYHARASERAYEKPEDFISEQHRETMAVCWLKKRFTSFDSGRFWLAPKPDQEPEVIAWDGSPFTRIAIYVGLEDSVTGQRFYLVTAHFDHQGIQARINSAHLIMNKSLELSKGLPVFVCGDFNTFEHGGGGPETFTAFCKHFCKYDDVRVAAKKILGLNGTWAGWEYNAFKESVIKEQFPGLTTRWDHLFISKSNVNVLRTAVPDDRFKIEWDDAEKTVYPSDHRPIICDFLFN